MSNKYYAHGIYPAPNSAGASANMRNELDLITTGFDKLPELTGNNNKAVVVSADGTKLEATNALTGVSLTSGAINDSPIGLTTSRSGKFTNLTATGSVALRKITVSQSEVANFDGTRLIGLPEPQLSSEAATKSYVDTVSKVPGPVGPQGQIGPQGIKGDIGLTGSPGTTAVLKGTFGVSKSFYDLPVDGYFPANWDAPGNPPAPYQAQIGDALLYLGGYFELTTEAGNEIITEGAGGYAVESTGQNHAWVYVGADFDVTGWAYCGSIIGPKGDKGDPGVPGLNGQDGAPGASGADGAIGPPGADGQNGEPGETPYIFWDSANNRIGITVSGETTYTPTLIGPAGPTGQIGPQGPEGTVTGAVTTFNSRAGAVSLISSDVTNALGFVPAENDGGNAYGTWNISILGNANTANSATNASTAALATNATNAVNATTAASCTGNAATATLASTATNAINASTQPVNTANETIASTAFVSRDFAKVGGSNASGTWPINITGKAVTADTQVSTDRSNYIATTAFVGNYFVMVNGSNAIGTWDIDISGNAATVTNGLYSTGSYANPSWLVSIPGTKVTSAVANANVAASCTGNAATVTNGVYTTGTYSDPLWITGLAGSKIIGSVSSATTASTAANLTATGTNSITMATGGFSRMSINSAGKVGIGTTNPQRPLHIIGPSGSAGTAPTGSIQAGIWIENAINTSLSFVTPSGQTASVTGLSPGASVGYAAYGMNDNGGSPFTYIGVGPGAPEKMRIDNNGTLLVGTSTNPVSSATPRMALYADGGDAFNIKQTTNGNTTINIWQTGTSAFSALQFFKGNTQASVGNVVCTPSGTTYNTSSDYRLKEDVKPMQGALDKVVKLNPVTYKWKVDGSDGQGFIAHELQAVIPDAVTGEKDAVYKDGSPKYQGVDASRLVATLVKAIQELKSEIDALKSAQASN